MAGGGEGVSAIVIFTVVLFTADTLDSEAVSELGLSVSPMAKWGILITTGCVAISLFSASTGVRATVDAFVVVLATSCMCWLSGDAFSTLGTMMTTCPCLVGVNICGTAALSG